MLVFKLSVIDNVNMPIYCEGCSSDRRSSWPLLDEGPKIHQALVVAGSLSNAQRRTMKFEIEGPHFSLHPENACDIIVNIGAKAFLSFLYDEDRPILALDAWRGTSDTARYAQQMTNHHYIFNALAIDDTVDKEIQRRDPEKIYGIPVYIVSAGSIALREYDPDGSVVLSGIRRL